jgi:excisionase family DNA binding protein
VVAQTLRPIEAQAPIATDYRGAAAYLGISLSSITKLAKEGRLPLVRYGRSVRLLYSDLEAYAIANRQAVNCG